MATLTQKDYIQLTLPSTLVPSPDLVELLIRKWQTTLHVAFNVQTVLCHIEASYTENQNILISDLVAYDLLTLFFNKVLGAISDNTVTGATTVSGGVKRVQTGPAEVEYFDIPNKANAEALALLLKDGSLISEIKGRICSEADQLRVKVHICEDFKVVKIPIIIRNK